MWEYRQLRKSKRHIKQPENRNDENRHVRGFSSMLPYTLPALIYIFYRLLLDHY